MRFGICTTPDHLDLLEELGYDYIEMSVTKTMGLSEEEKEEARRKLADSPVKCEAFNILFPKTMELIDGNTDEAALREYLHRAMALIKSFGAEVVVFGSGKCRRCPDNLSLREAYPKLVQVYRITGEVAKEYGITVVIEPLSRKEANTINLMSEGAMLEADVNMENVHVFSDYSNYDPEGSTFQTGYRVGYDYGAYPNPFAISDISILLPEMAENILFQKKGKNMLPTLGH